METCIFPSGIFIFFPSDFAVFVFAGFAQNLMEKIKMPIRKMRVSIFLLNFLKIKIYGPPL